MSETIEVTVKTMDSQSRKFTVPVNITVKDFKEKVSPEVNVPANQQRIIFCGRVLADDFKLTREHHEKSLHLVQRLPTITTANQTRSTSTTSSSGTSTNTNPTTGAAGQNVFNPAQLSQMIFDQMFFGPGGMMEPGAPGAPGGAVPMPGLPGQMNPGGVNFMFGMGQGNPQQRASTPGAQARPMTRQGVSAPRRMVATAGHILNQLEIVLARLESDHTNSDVTTSATAPAPEVNVSAPPSDENILESLEEDTTEVGTTDSNGTHNNNQTSTATGATAGTSARTCTNHPSLRELGQVYERMVEGQQRLRPFMNNMITFFNTDPPFTSTQSSEFQYTSRWLGNTLKAQQLLAEVQRVLSHAVIPVGRTPPRSVLVQAPRPNRGNHRPGNHAVPTPHPVVTPVQVNVPQTRPRMAFPIPPRMMGWGPQGAPGATNRPRMVSVASTVPQVIQGSVNGTPFRFRTITHTVNGGQLQRGNHQQPRNTATATPITNIASAATAGTNPQQPATSITTSSAPATNQGGTTTGSNMAVNQPQQPSTGTRFTVSPPTYHVQINATIAPRVQIQVNPTPGSNQEPQAVPAPINVNIEPHSATSGEQGVIETSQAATTDADHEAAVTGNIPNVPGIPQELMSSIFQNVARTLQENSGGNTGGDVMVVQGSDQNAIPDEISNMLSQSVWNVTNNVLSGEYNVPQTTASSMPQTTASSAPQTAASSTPQSAASSMPQTAASSTPRTTASSTPRTAASSTPQSAASTTPRTTASVSTTAPSNSLLAVVLDEMFTRLRLPRFPPGTVGRLHNDVTIFGPLLEPLRCEVRQLFFGGISPSREEIHRISHNLSESVSQNLSDMFSDASVRQDADIVESNLSLIKHSVRRTFEILFLTSESEFPRLFQKHFNQTVGLIIHLNKHLLSSGIVGLVELMQTYSKKDDTLGKFLKLVFSETKDVTADLTTLAVTFPARLSQVEQFVVSLPEEMPNSEPTVSMETPAHTEKEDKQPQGGNKEKDKKQEDPDAWKSDVPSDWVEVIAKDVEKQKGMPPQPPFSEAYIAGMPASKRRKVLS